MGSPRRRWLLGAVVGLFLLALASAAVFWPGANPFATPVPSAASTPPATSTPSARPGVQHVFVINLENKGYDRTWSADSTAPYLSGTLRDQGVLLTQYFGVAHHSLPNYIAQISGQGPNPQTQADCGTYTNFVQTGTADFDQAVGDGCVYPARVPTVADQLGTAGLRWKGYFEDMGKACRHPSPGAVDDTQRARPGDMYAARHNPFVYFARITGSPDCARNVVDLTELEGDLAQASTTANLTMISPNLCHDGHDYPCVDGEPGGLASADAWLREWVPRILASPAFAADGLLVITFDESDSAKSDSSACCGEVPGPNAARPGIEGPGGGRVGALVLSPFTAGGTSSDTPYNHYSLLATIEDTFSLPYLGYAATPGLARFGSDVFNTAHRF
ncbi:alkaline phosphatase family protein [Cryobacterium sp. TMT2-23]|uniref:alkaline phosphatase family protein n=1 Tax=Cryobacterium sp. TMT2-23 TaxID=1259252 RepID=UPI00106B4D15|nr:alkaline phosphatase family protein [Cryobacterium sp. TMT2-23]TFD16111.1 phosphoesterase [Cryobacterium sp. TMT2-23]